MALYCSPSLLRHIWSCKKVSCCPNVVFSVHCHFGLKCRTSEVFQDNGLFQCGMSFYGHYEDIHVWEEHLYWRYMFSTLPKAHNIPQCSPNAWVFPNAPKGFSMFTMLHGVPLHCFKVLTTYEPLEYICVPSLMHINYLYYMMNWTFKIP